MEKIEMRYERDTTGRRGEELRIYELDRGGWLAAVAAGK